MRQRGGDDPDRQGGLDQLARAHQPPSSPGRSSFGAGSHARAWRARAGRRRSPRARRRRDHAVRDLEDPVVALRPGVQDARIAGARVEDTRGSRSRWRRRTARHALGDGGRPRDRALAGLLHAAAASSSSSAGAGRRAQRGQRQPRARRRRACAARCAPRTPPRRPRGPRSARSGRSGRRRRPRSARAPARRASRARSIVGSLEATALPAASSSTAGADVGRQLDAAAHGRVCRGWCTGHCVTPE